MTNFTNYTDGIKTATALDPTTVRIVCSRAQGRPREGSACRSCPSTSGRTSRRRRPARATPTSRRSSAAAPSRRSPSRRAATSRWSATPTTGASQAGHRRDLLRALPGRRHHGLRPEDGQTSTPPGACPRPSSRRSSRARRAIKAVAYYYYDWDYLEFNCYDKSSSLGNPVLRDWRFRNALNYAINQQQLCPVAYDGLAAPGTTHHPARHLDRPRLPLAAAGRPALHLRSGQGRPAPHPGRLPARERACVSNKQGKPIRLRLYATTDSTPEQIDAKLIAGWLGKLGLKINLSVIDDGTLTSDIYNSQGQHVWTPDFDLSCGTGGYIRPRPDAQLLHDRRDRQPQRALLVERPVRRAVHASRRRPSTRRPAPGADLADAADHVPADALDRAHLPRVPRGLQHGASGPAGRRCSTAAGRPSAHRTSTPT